MCVYVRGGGGGIGMHLGGLFSLSCTFEFSGANNLGSGGQQIKVEDEKSESLFFSLTSLVWFQSQKIL